MKKRPTTQEPKSPKPTPLPQEKEPKQTTQADSPEDRAARADPTLIGVSLAKPTRAMISAFATLPLPHSDKEPPEEAQATDAPPTQNKAGAPTAGAKEKESRKTEQRPTGTEKAAAASAQDTESAAPSQSTPANDAPPPTEEEKSTELKTQEVTVSQILPALQKPPPPPDDAPPRPGNPRATATKRTRRLRALNREALRGGLLQGSFTLQKVEPGFYEKAEEIGRGRISQIVKARDKRFSRVVALKEAIRGVSAEDFLREARLAIRLQHTGILPVYDLGCWPNGDPVYATRYFRGETFDELIRAARHPEERLALLPRLLAVAHVIAYVHTEKVAHLDIRPKNILVSAFGESVVTGWSLARRLDQSEPESPTQGSASLEEAVYRPPEQANGDPLDERTDVYALGALLYYLLAGEEPPFPQNLLTEPAGASLLARAPWAPPELVAIVDKAMQLSPENRYPSAQEFVQALSRFEAAQLAASYRPHVVVRAARSLRRHWALAASTFALIGALAFGFLFTLKQLRDTRDAAQNEREQAALAYAAAKEAEERAESRTAQLTLSFAQSSLSRDPTEALAWLKSLPDVPSAASAARLIAAEAQEQGVARHLLKGHQGPVVALATSPKSNYLASASEDASILLWEASPSGAQVKPPRALLGHKDALTRIALSPNGTLLASASRDKTVILWEVESGKSQTLQGHTGSVFDVAFSPDGKWLASAGEDGALYLWEVACAAPGQASPCSPRQIFLGEEGPLYVVRFSPDSKSLAFAGKDKKIRLARVSGGDPRLLGEHLNDVWDLAFSPDGKLLASGSRDRTVRFWDLTTSLPLKPLWGHNGDIVDVEFSPDGRVLASASFDGTLRLWDIGDDYKSRVLRGHKDRVVRLAFSPDGKELASASRDGTVVRWEISCLPASPEDTSQNRGYCGPRQVLRGHEGALSDVVFSGGEEALLFSAGRDASIRVWDVSQDTRPSAQSTALSGPKDDVSSVAFSPDGRLLASASFDKNVYLWETDAGEKAPRVLSGHEGAVSQVAFSPDGRYIVSISRDKTARLWEPSSPDGSSPRVLRGHTGEVLDAAFSADGALLATASKDKTVILWDLASDTSHILRGHEGEVLDVAFSPDGRYIASASKDKTVILWDVQSAKGGAEARVQTFTDHKDIVYRVAFSPDGALLASAGKDKTVILREIGPDPSTPPRILSGHEGEIAQIAFSPDGSLLASAGSDRSIRLWDTKTGEMRTLSGHEDAIYQVVFSVDGAYLASASKDKTVRLWDVKTGQSQVFGGHKGDVLDVAFSPNGPWLASGSRDDEVRLFRNTLPLDIGELQAWLEQATSAILNQKDQLTSP